MTLQIAYMPVRRPTPVIVSRPSTDFPVKVQPVQKLAHKRGRYLIYILGW